LVLASHIIFTAYGFWLPNDPRGSWSDFVRSWELLRFGDATKTDERRSLAHREHDRQLRLAGKQALKYPPVRFTGEQALAIARGFARAIEESGYVMYACSVLPQHVHGVVGRHAHPAERIIGHLKGRATQTLRAAALHPFERFADEKGNVPSVWAHRAWKVFLDSERDILRAIEYVEDNPVREGKKKQRWSFVTPFGL
jgi:REP element-mobilizing transposase RayT